MKKNTSKYPKKNVLLRNEVKKRLQEGLFIAIEEDSKTIILDHNNSIIIITMMFDYDYLPYEKAVYHLIDKAKKITFQTYHSLEKYLSKKCDGKFEKFKITTEEDLKYGKAFAYYIERVRPSL